MMSTISHIQRGLLQTHRPRLSAAARLGPQQLAHTTSRRQQCRSIHNRIPSHRLLCQADREVEAVPSAVFSALDSVEALEAEEKWIAGMVALWLDEEWTPLEVHQQLGAATGAAYHKLRAGGERDVATILLGLSSELMTFNFRDTFTSPFEVANKVVEMLMMRSGTDVCCTSEEDCERLQRYESSQQPQPSS